MNFSRRDTEIMGLALEEAKIAGEQGNFPIGAALIIDNQLIGIGKNQLYTADNWYSHAENELIRKYSTTIRNEYKKGSKIELFSTLEPCCMCFGTILLHRIPRVVYGCPDPYGGVASLDNSSFPIFYKNRWPTIEGGLLAEESYSLLVSFFERENTSEFNEILDTYKKIKF